MSTSIPLPVPPPPPSNINTSTETDLAPPSSIQQRSSTSPLAIHLPTQTEPFPSLYVEIADPGPQMSSYPEPSTFLPFFTLISDTTHTHTNTNTNTSTGVGTKAESPTTYHPSRIHYLFSDDDTEEWVDACMRASAAQGENGNMRNPTDLAASMDGDLNTEEKSVSTGAQAGQKGREGRRKEERVILIDMASSGDTVLRAQSLSSKWQVTNCEIGKAPMWEEEGEGKEGNGVGGGGRGLMLRIEGMETGVGKDGLGVREGDGKGRLNVEGGRDDEFGEEDMERLLESFDKKMGVLRKVLGGVGQVSGTGTNDEDAGGIGGVVENVGGESEKEKEREAVDAL